MSFHYSAEDIRVEDNHILKARLQRADGEWQDSEIDLNNFLGNDNGQSRTATIPASSIANVLQGHFFWEGSGFSGSAENVHFTIEGDGSVPVLRATLFEQNGNGETRDVNLSERVSNNDGHFNFSEFDAAVWKCFLLTMNRLNIGVLTD